MTEQQVDRQMPITQIDELWAIAEKRWGSAGRRTPAPDPRFRELREYLEKIEKLFSKDKEQLPLPVDRSFKSPKRKIAAHQMVDDDDEIPF